MSRYFSKAQKTYSNLKSFTRSSYGGSFNYKPYLYTTLSMGALLATQKYFKIQTATKAEMNALYIDKQRLKQMFELISDEITVYHFYDSQNPLHDEFNQLNSYVLKEACKKNCAEIASIDINELDPHEESKLMHATKMNKAQIKAQSAPVLVLKSNCSFKTIDNKVVNGDEENFRVYLRNLTRSQHVTSINELSAALKNNKSLNDCCVAYYLPLREGQDHKKAISEFEERNIMVFNLLKGETENIAVITDEELAQKCKLEPSKFYAYFKPSYINGFENLVDKDLNVEYLQAYEGIYRDKKEGIINELELGRDEFVPNYDYLSSDEFLGSIGGHENMFTEKLISEHFDSAFERTTTTEFLLNPNFESRWESDEADVPQCFIYIPDEYMKKYIFEIKNALEDYKGSFEFIYTNNYSVANKYLFLDEFPDVMPFFVIVDKSKKIPVRKLTDEPIKNFEDVIVDSENVPEGTPFYYTKYKEPIFLSNLTQEIEKFLEKYLEGKMTHYYQTEKMVQYTRVKEICGDTFKREIVNNPKVEQCIVEVFKHDCPSCMYNGKVFNAFSRKLEKNGILNQLPCFRLAIDNKIPYLGSFAYSPIYFFLKKEDGKVTEISIIDIPVKYEQFKSKLIEYTGIEKLKEINLVPKFQVKYHFQQEDLKPGFDIDQDLIDKAKEDEEQKKKEEEEKKPKNIEK